MLRAMSIAFPILAITVFIGWHYYIWARLVRDVQPPNRLRKAGLALILTLGTAFLFAMLVGHFAPARALKPAFILGFSWLGTSFTFFILLIIADIAKLGIWGVRRMARLGPDSPERRRTTAQIIAGVVATTGLVSTLVGTFSAFGTPKTEHVRVELPRLSNKMVGTRIVQLSDLHIGPILDRAWVEKVVAQVQSISPDLVVITGDLVDGSVEKLRDDVAPLGTMQARYGVYFVTGNHEFIRGAEPWVEELQRIGIRVLRNEHVLIGEGDDAFCLAGVEDFSSRNRDGGRRHDVAAAVRGVDPSREVVLLSHQPKSIDDAAAHGVGLLLAGHTHGGQIYPWRYFVYLQQPYVSGLHKVGGTQLYVNRGTGFWGPPVRVGAPPEITVIELVKD